MGGFERKLDRVGNLRCCKCKKHKHPDQFGNNSQVPLGKKANCKQCDSDKSTAFYHKNRARVLERRAERKEELGYGSRPRVRFQSLLRGAAARNIEVSLTFETYLNLIESGVCHYCKDPLAKSGGGIDRKNSAIGYHVENCVSCCPTCNNLKGSDRLSYEEMFIMVKALRQVRTTLTFWGDQERVSTPLVTQHVAETSSPSADCT